MEIAGIKVDAVRLADISKEFATRLKALESEIHALAGQAFNIASPKQLGVILFENMGFKGARNPKLAHGLRGRRCWKNWVLRGRRLPIKCWHGGN